MIENRPILNFITHLVLIFGVALIALPVYVTFIASTQTAADVVQAPMSLLPGGHFIDNYWGALTQGAGNAKSVGVGRMMLNSLISALVIAIGKITISGGDFHCLSMAGSL